MTENKTNNITKPASTIDLKDYAKYLEGLTEQERAAAISILTEYSKNGYSTLMDDLKYADFEEIPVDIDTFLDSDDYLGQGL